jgi:hypothetical protein
LYPCSRRDSSSFQLPTKFGYCTFLYMGAGGIDLAFVSTIFLLDFEYVLSVCYSLLLFFTLLHWHDIHILIMLIVLVLFVIQHNYIHCIQFSKIAVIVQLNMQIRRRLLANPIISINTTWYIVSMVIVLVLFSFKQQRWTVLLI